MTLLQFALRTVIVAVVILVSLAAIVALYIEEQSNSSGYFDEYGAPVSDGVCNIAIVPVVGDITTIDAPMQTEGEDMDYSIYTSADQVSRSLRMAANDSAIRGVLLRIDSYGGSPAGSAIMMNEAERVSVPVVALVREAATSGGYMAALGADRIIAGEYSDVGSIGITYSYLSNVGKNAREGYEFVQLSSGAFKDTGNPNKPVTEAERKLYERDMNAYHRIFVEAVAERRGMPVEAVELLADGSSMPGALAREKGLVDDVGDQETARDWFANVLGIPRNEVIFCEQ